MEFEEMKKIWDDQNNEPMYVINQNSMHKYIKKKKHSSSKVLNITEIGLIIINVIVGAILIVKNYLDDQDIMDYIMAAYMLVFAAYIMYERLVRQKGLQKFDRSMLGDLEYAISKADKTIGLAKRVVLGYNLPILALILAKFLLFDTSWSKLLFIGPLFAVAYLLSKWEMKRIHLPRKQKLISLRDKLVQEA